MKIYHYAVLTAAVCMILACTDVTLQAPAGVAATPGNQSVTISCDEDESVLAYNLYWSMTEEVSEASNSLKSITLPYTHRGLENGSNYYYCISAVNAEGESVLSETVTASPELISVPAPASIESRSGEGKIELSWPAVAGAYSYNLYWSTTAGVGLDSECIMNVSMPYVHDNLIYGLDYYYRLTSVDSEGESVLSEEFTASPRILYSTPLEKLLAVDGAAGDHFGYSVSISGDYAVVGAHNEDDCGDNAGAAYVYHRTDENSWSEGTKLSAPDGEEDDNFGYSVSICGDYAVIGAYLEDEHGRNHGAAYVYRRTGENSWDGGTKLLAPDGEVEDWFGYSVSINGDYVVVGTYSSGPSNDFIGVAYVYHRTGENSWDGGTKLIAPTQHIMGCFGYSVSISGDYAVVGEPFPWNSNGKGAAYIFRRTGENSWDGGTPLLAPDGEVNDQFGYSVSISGDYAVIGANLEDESGDAAGAAYVYRRTGANSWDGGIKLLALDGVAEDSFGTSVSISGDCIVVGAAYEDENGSDSGAVYIFRRGGGNSWDGGTKLLVSDGLAGDRVGVSVSINGDYAVVGAGFEDENGADAGAAYIF